MTLQEAIDFLNKNINNETIKKYTVAKEKIREKVYVDKEMELYKETDVAKYYIELPYEQVVFDDNKYVIKQRSYSYRIEYYDRTILGCTSYCGYSRDEITKRLDEVIGEDCRGGLK